MGTGGAHAKGMIAVFASVSPLYPPPREGRGGLYSRNAALGSEDLYSRPRRPLLSATTAFAFGRGGLCAFKRYDRRQCMNSRMVLR